MYIVFSISASSETYAYTKSNEREQYIKETRTSLQSLYTHGKMQEQLIALIGHK